MHAPGFGLQGIEVFHWWKFGRSNWARQCSATLKLHVNRTQMHDQIVMRHLVQYQIISGDKRERIGIGHRAISRAIKSSFRTPVLVLRPPLAGKVQVPQRVARRQSPLAPLHVIAHVDKDQVAVVEVTSENGSLSTSNVQSMIRHANWMPALGEGYFLFTYVTLLTAVYFVTVGLGGRNINRK